MYSVFLCDVQLWLSQASGLSLAQILSGPGPTVKILRGANRFSWGTKENSNGLIQDIRGIKKVAPSIDGFYCELGLFWTAFDLKSAQFAKITSFADKRNPSLEPTLGPQGPPLATPKGPRRLLGGLRPQDLWPRRHAETEDSLWSHILKINTESWQTLNIWKKKCGILVARDRFQVHMLSHFQIHLYKLKSFHILGFFSA